MRGILTFCLCFSGWTGRKGEPSISVIQIGSDSTPIQRCRLKTQAGYDMDILSVCVCVCFIPNGRERWKMGRTVEKRKRKKMGGKRVITLVYRVWTEMAEAYVTTGTWWIICRFNTYMPFYICTVHTHKQPVKKTEIQCRWQLNIH